MFIFILMMISCIDFRPYTDAAGGSGFNLQMYAFTQRAYIQFIIIIIIAFVYHQNINGKKPKPFKMFGNPLLSFLVNWILNWPNQSPKNRFLLIFASCCVHSFSYSSSSCSSYVDLDIFYFLLSINSKGSYFIYFSMIVSMHFTFCSDKLNLYEMESNY